MLAQFYITYAQFGNLKALNKLMQYITSVKDNINNIKLSQFLLYGIAIGLKLRLSDENQQNSTQIDQNMQQTIYNLIVLTKNTLLYSQISKENKNIIIANLQEAYQALKELFSNTQDIQWGEIEDLEKDI